MDNNNGPPGTLAILPFFGANCEPRHTPGAETLDKFSRARLAKGKAALG